MTTLERRYASAIDVLETAGIELIGRGQKRTLRCPFHEDRTPSAMARDRVFHCSVCGTLRPRELAERLGVAVASAPWSPMPAPAQTTRPVPSPPPGLDRGAIAELWRRAQARARDDLCITADHDVWTWLSGRGLAEAAYELEMLGIPCGADLPRAIWYWPRRSYMVVSALYDGSGDVASLSARAIDSAQEPRLRSLPGVPTRGLAFASPAGRELLRQQRAGRTVLVGEGLTDALALATVAGGRPVLSAPGAGMASGTVGAWARGRRVLLALDADGAGERGARDAAAAIQRWGGEPIRLRLPAAADVNDALLELGPDRLARRLDDLLGAEEEEAQRAG